jgi:hypothetical protein
LGFCRSRTRSDDITSRVALALPENLFLCIRGAAESVLSASVSCRGKVERSVYILISRLGTKVFIELPVAVHSCGSAALVNAAVLAFAFTEGFAAPLISS